MYPVNIACSNIIEQDGKFLFVMESKEIAKGRFNLPAGKMEFGETVMEGAIREAKEETGLTVEPVRLVGIYQRPASKENTNTTNFVFHSKIVSGQITPTPEHPEIRFLSMEEITKLDAQDKLRAKYILHALADYMAGSGHSLEMVKIIR